MADKIISEVKLVQSSWTRGIADTVLHGRTDTDILQKSAHDIVNMSIMQQGGLVKRPCTKLLRSINPGSIHYSASIVSPDGQHNTILVQSNNGEVYIYFIDSDKTINIGTFALITSHVQDGNVVLIAPAWQNITINFTDATVAIEPFRIIHKPIKAVSTSITGEVWVAKSADGETSKDKYFSVGEKVLLFSKDASTISVFKFSGVIFINGLYIECPFHVPGEKYFSGTVIYGSTVGAQADSELSYDNKNYYGTSAAVSEVGFFNYTWNGDYPKYLALFQNRLWCAGVVGDNKTLWASSIGDMHEFRQTTTDDDAPISLVISGTPNTPNISGIHAGITISVFTDVGVYAFINQTNTSITPTNFFIQRQNGHLCAKVTPVEYDQQLVYVQANNSNIRSLQYSLAALMTDNNLTILCPDIVNNPSQLAVTNSLDGSDNAYLFALNSDGSLLVFQSVATQQIAGWSRWTFSFKIVQLLGTSNNRLIALVDDSNGFSVVEFKNGIYADHNGGIPECFVKTNPFGFRDYSIGDLLFVRKKISKIKAYVYKTDGIIINDKDCSINHFDDEYTEISTGVIEVVPDTNFETFNFVTVSHKSNMPFSLLSLFVKLDLGS